MSKALDYCTLWFEGWWGHCCQAHDEAYANQLPRLPADLDLLICVVLSAPNELLAPLAALIGGAMFAVVGVAGWWFYSRAGKGL